MDRRSFIQRSLAVLAMLKLSHHDVFAKRKKTTVDVETVKETLEVTCENIKAEAEDIKVRFLGTGAAGWSPGGMRRNSSILLDDKVLIDFTKSVEDMIPADIHPRCLFITHSHNDHYQTESALRSGVKRIYVSETWVERAKKDFAETADKTKLPVPELIPLKIGECVTEHGLKITPLPANHATSYLNEQTLIYLIEKGTTETTLGVRLLYATDTGGIMGLAGKISGIDSHVANGRAITALIMEATMGIGHDEDFRIFNHSSVHTVLRTANMLTATKRYLPPKGQPVYLTHMAPSLHGNLTQENLNESLPSPLRAAYDGLEITLKAEK